MALNQPTRSRHPIRQRLLLIAGSLILALVCAEILVANFLLREDGTYQGRPLPPYGAINNATQRALFAQRRQIWASGWAAQGHTRYDQELGWTIRASTQNHDATAHSNRLAARSMREYSLTPTEETHRILTFGDSFTYGYIVSDADTWQARIEAMEPEHEVINFGIPGYGSGQALLRFRRCGKDLGARTIVLGLMLENIGRNVNRYRPLYFPQTQSLAAKPRFTFDQGRLELLPIPYKDEGALLDAIGDGSILADLAAHEYWLDRPKIPFGEGLASVRLAAGYLSYRQRQPRRLWTHPEDEPYRVTLAILKSFHREAMATGASLAPILVFPTEDGLALLLAGQDKYWQGLLAELSRSGIPWLDLSDALLRYCRSLGKGAAVAFAGGHLNPAGNQVVAEAVLAWLKRK